MKTHTNVDFTDNFMFTHVMRNPKVCAAFLECLLPWLKIDRIEYVDAKGAIKPEVEKTLEYARDRHGVRLDAYVDDGKSVYNIEMQATKKAAQPQRARFNQSHLDLNQLERSTDYEQLRPSYVIFICKHDPFGKGYYQYSFEDVCQEDPSLKLNDGAYKVFFNAAGTVGTIRDKLKDLLQYINDAEAFPTEETENPLIQEIDKLVEEANHDAEWRRAYMMYQLQLQDERKQGRAEGRLEGLTEGELKGKLKGKLEAALAMLQDQVPSSQIARYTGLPVSEIEALERV